MNRTIRILLAGLAWLAPEARATYSIIACDAITRACGVAVQTNNLAVGASVPYARAGVGAIASQFETNPAYGPRGLDLLARGTRPAGVLKQLLLEDGNFGGDGPEARQVAIVSLNGETAVHTGAQAAASSWAGSRAGPGYSIQGNGLAGVQVVDSMERTFRETSGELADRLMAALAAGEAAGGQTTGRESAAILVRTARGFPFDVDLRVDHSADPVGDLRIAFDMQAARQMVVQARLAAGKADAAGARQLLIAAVARAPMWVRIWLQAARVATSIEQQDLALQYLTIAFSMNAQWARIEIGDGRYAALGSDPLFHRWVSTGQEHKASAPDQLLEVGRAKEALAILEDGSSGESSERAALRAEALAAVGRYTDARAAVREGLERDPKNMRLILKASRWRALDPAANPR